jgi:hypothetical protein
MKYLLKLFIPFLVFTLFIPHAFAKKSIGIVALLDGNVWRISNGNKKELLNNKSKIYEGDALITGTDAFIKILMKDDTVFDLGEATKFTFEKFKLKTKKDRKAKYNFSYGKMRSIFTIKAKNKDDLKIKTPDVVMGVRGTEILADVYEKKGKLTTNIALVSGKLNINVPSVKGVINSLDIVPGSMFSSGDFVKTKDIKKSLKTLNKVQMKTLASNSMMKKGAFLYETVNGNRSMPLNKEMKLLINKAKAGNLSHKSRKAGEGKKGDHPRRRGGKGHNGDGPQDGDPQGGGPQDGGQQGGGPQDGGQQGGGPKGSGQQGGGPKGSVPPGAGTGGPSGINLPPRLAPGAGPGGHLQNHNPMDNIDFKNRLTDQHLNQINNTFKKSNRFKRPRPKFKKPNFNINDGVTPEFTIPPAPGAPPPMPSTPLDSVSPP